MKEVVDLNKLSKKELTKFARQLAKTNTALWNAICLTEELVHSPIFQAYETTCDENKEILERLAQVLKTIKKNDESFIDVETYGSYFQSFDYLATKLNEYLD